ncbi:MAG: metallophosphoesterase [Ruminiclostridium sp.]
MRGINISSIIFLLIILWNVVAFGLLSHMKLKSANHQSSGVGILGGFIINVVLIICLLYFSSNIGITRYSIASNRLLPDFEGYKILQISDFHNGSFNGGTEVLVQKVISEKPDIIVLTGDIIDETAINLSVVSKLVSQLVLIAPVYAVSGNHDIWYEKFSKLQEMLESKGVVLLENKKVTLIRGNSHINLFGIGDPETWKDTSSDVYLEKTMSLLKPEQGYNILLFHRANMFDMIKGKGYQLVLTGHMHGGQIQIPFVGGLISPQQDRRWFPKYTDGRWEEAGTVMVVSRGLGNNVPVPRILNPPEVVVVTLKCK